MDKITEKHGLEGIYGLLYRLSEDTDASVAIEQTAGNRYEIVYFSRYACVL